MSSLMKYENSGPFLVAVNHVNELLCGREAGIEIVGLAKYLCTVVDCGNPKAPATTGFGLMFLVFIVMAVGKFEGNNAKFDFKRWTVAIELKDLMKVLVEKTELWWSSGRQGDALAGLTNCGVHIGPMLLQMTRVQTSEPWWQFLRFSTGQKFCWSLVLALTVMELPDVRHGISIATSRLVRLVAVQTTILENQDAFDVALLHGLLGRLALICALIGREEQLARKLCEAYASQFCARLRAPARDRPLRDVVLVCEQLTTCLLGDRPAPESFAPVARVIDAALYGASAPQDFLNILTEGDAKRMSFLERYVRTLPLPDGRFRATGGAQLVSKLGELLQPLASSMRVATRAGDGAARDGAAREKARAWLDDCLARSATDPDAALAVSPAEWLRNLPLATARAVFPQYLAAIERAACESYVFPRFLAELVSPGTPEAQRNTLLAAASVLARGGEGRELVLAWTHCVRRAYDSIVDCKRPTISAYAVLLRTVILSAVMLPEVDDGFPMEPLTELLLLLARQASDSIPFFVVSEFARAERAVVDAAAAAVAAAATATAAARADSLPNTYVKIVSALSVFVIRECELGSPQGIDSMVRKYVDSRDGVTCLLDALVMCDLLKETKRFLGSYKLARRSLAFVLNDERLSHDTLPRWLSVSVGDARLSVSDTLVDTASECRVILLNIVERLSVGGGGLELSPVDVKDLLVNSSELGACDGVCECVRARYLSCCHGVPST